MREPKGEVIELWCYSDRQLNDVFADFRRLFPIEDYHHDSENVWEWIDGKTIDGCIGFNISREHEDGIGNPNRPIRFSLVLRFTQQSSDLIAQELANVLSTEIFAGNVEYISHAEEELRFNVLKNYSSQNLADEM